MSNDRAGSEDENLDPTTGADAAADDNAVDAVPDATDEAAADDAVIDEAEAEFPAGDYTEEGDVSLEKVGAGAVAATAAAGSARAAARQAGARSGTTAGKAAPTRARGEAEGHSGNVFSRLGRFLREVIAELGKVIWPSQRQMITYTIVVIVFLIFMIALVAGLDLLFAWGVRSVFG